MTRVLLSVFLVAVAGRNAAAQCPDGTPPPCGRVPAARPARAVDSNLIAVLPLRVTTSDTLLGEGFAELLATQFTGEGSPRAVDMATVLSAWRRAGGGLRAPLPRARAVQLARELGAGLVSEGSIVGLGARVAVSLSLVSVPGGEVRGTAEPVSGPADSLDALLRRTTTGLLATVGGQARGSEGTRFTESPTAMRAYLEGLSAWRRGRLAAAAQALDRAIAEDSSFAQARFRRYLAANWGIPGVVSGAPYARLAWDRRAGLSQRERAIVETLLGPQYPAPRLLETRFEARRRLADQYPDSPDAWYFLGDYYFHYGRAVAPAQYLELSRTYLERSAAIDSQATVLSHLVWIGILLRDTSLLRRAWPALDRTDDAPKWMLGWLAAATLGDARLLASLRRRPVDNAADPGAIPGAYAAMGATIPPRLLDEMFERWTGAIADSNRREAVQVGRGLAVALAGRPVAAERVWAGLPSELASVSDELRVALDLAGDGMGLDVAGSVQRLAEAGRAGGATRAACIAELWHRVRGDSTSVGAERFRSSQPRCALALDAATLGFSRAPDADVRLATADSAVHNSVSTATSEGFEAPALARAWERRANARRAAVAVRYSLFPDLGVRMEGRLAALAGDTVGAVYAYRRFLDLTANSEPAFIPARDSVRGELARLERRP